MVNALIPLSTQIIPLNNGQHLVVHEVNYTGASDTLATDVAVVQATPGTAAGGGAAFHLAGGTAPDVVVAAPSGGVVTCTIGGSTTGTTGRILIVLRAVGNTSL